MDILHYIKWFFWAAAMFALLHVFQIPLRMIYDMLNYHAYGDYQIGNTNLLVSAGISGWGYPFRNEANTCYDVIELRPAE